MLLEKGKCKKEMNKEKGKRKWIRKKEMNKEKGDNFMKGVHNA